MLVLTSTIDQNIILNLEKTLIKQKAEFRRVKLQNYYFFVTAKPLSQKQLKKVLAISDCIIHHEINTPYQLASHVLKDYLQDNFFSEARFLGHPFLMIAGPCSIESYEQLEACLDLNQKLGIEYTRGGIVKPRTSPYSFQGLKNDALAIIEDCKDIQLVSEIMTIEQIEQFKDHVAIFQIGARNMQNFDLLKAVGKSNKPVIIKRHPSATIEEWLLSAEYVLLEGNPNVILCERGIRTFETSYRNTLDLNAIAYVKQVSHLPVLADPSHGTGIASLVGPLALASIAAGADGLLIETHPDSDMALSDADQAIDFAALTRLSDQIEQLLAMRTTYENSNHTK